VSFVPDASVVVAALIDSGPVGVWSLTMLAAGNVVAPHLLPVEVASVLRRAAVAGSISDENASLAHSDFLDMRFTFLPYAPFAERAWELRHTVTTYDAWYVAIAEALEVELLTVDARLSRAPGLRCIVRTAPG
jgi:predicted nucleic acid-binding protein